MMKGCWDSKWEKFYKKFDGNNYPETSVVRFIATNYYSVKNRSGVKILDLGCGTGATQLYLAHEGFVPYGIDASPTAIEKAKARLELDKMQSTICIGDFTQLPYNNNFMDAVIDAASIQHNNTESIHKIISEIYRILKKNGKFFGMMIARSHNLSCTDYKTHFFKKPEIRILFNKFTTVSIDYMTYTQKNEKNLIKFWLVEAQK